MKRRTVLKSATMAGAGLLTNRLGQTETAAVTAAVQSSAQSLNDYDTFDLGDFRLLSGDVLQSATLAYKTYGELSPAKDNVIVYPTWYAGRHTSNEAFIGEDLALDPSRYFIVVPNQFGNGLSSSPSNTPAPQDRMRFPLVHPYDNVRAQHELLTGRFGIERIKLVVGFSMSGQQAFHWGALYPDLVDRIAPICGSAKTSTHNYVFLEGIKAALTADCHWANGEYTTPPVAGLRAFSRVYTGWFASQGFFRQGLHRAFGDDLEGIFSMAEGLFGSFDANDLLAMLATWQSADISAHPRFGNNLSTALAAIRARAFVMPSQTDLYFPPEDNELEVARMPNAELRIIPTLWGHLAGGARNPEDTAWMSEQLQELLASER
jgi:homoserine O-acetyltransferase